MNLQVIAYAKNGFKDKFGIPRQSRENSIIETRIVFCPTYAVPESLRGIEDFSHLWLIWGFSQVEKEREQTKKWYPTVRPPRLGGNKRIGVFATRSPYRPNPLGLTSVKLLRVEKNAAGAYDLIVAGADLLDSTPIYDIKPYLSFSDSHPEAQNGFAQPTKDYRLTVIGLTLQTFTEWVGEVATPQCLIELIEILSQDPRPAYQDDAKRIYKMDYADFCVHFSVQKDILNVIKIEK